MRFVKPSKSEKSRESVIIFQYVSGIESELFVRRDIVSAESGIYYNFSKYASGIESELRRDIVSAESGIYNNFSKYVSGIENELFQCVSGESEQFVGRDFVSAELRIYNNFSSMYLVMKMCSS